MKFLESTKSDDKFVHICMFMIISDINYQEMYQNTIRVQRYFEQRKGILSLLKEIHLLFSYFLDFMIPLIIF